MTIEDILIELGDRPLQKSPYSKVVFAIVNALLPTGKAITLTMQGHEILSLIYQLPDTALGEKILSRKVGTLRDTDHYRTLVLFFSALIGFITVTVALLEVFRDSGPSGTGSGVFTALINGLVSLIKALAPVQ